MTARRGEYDVDPRQFQKRDPNRPRIPLADLQFYFEKVHERALRYVSTAIEAADHYAKRNPTVKDAQLVELRLHWFALEEAAGLIETRIERLTKEEAARIEAAKRVEATDAPKVLA